jgi:hypothetical protein
MEPEGSLPCSLRAKSPSLAPILSQINPVHNSPAYFPKIHSNIIGENKSAQNVFGEILTAAEKVWSRI